MIIGSEDCRYYSTILGDGLERTIALVSYALNVGFLLGGMTVRYEMKVSDSYVHESEANKAKWMER